MPIFSSSDFNYQQFNFSQASMSQKSPQMSSSSGNGNEEEKVSKSEIICSSSGDGNGNGENQVSSNENIHPPNIAKCQFMKRMCHFKFALLDLKRLLKKKLNQMSEQVSAKYKEILSQLKQLDQEKRYCKNCFPSKNLLVLNQKIASLDLKSIELEMNNSESSQSKNQLKTFLDTYIQAWKEAFQNSLSQGLINCYDKDSQEVQEDFGELSKPKKVESFSSSESERMNIKNRKDKSDRLEEVYYLKSGHSELEKLEKADFKCQLEEQIVKFYLKTHTILSQKSAYDLKSNDFDIYIKVTKEFSALLKQNKTFCNRCNSKIFKYFWCKRYFHDQVHLNQSQFSEDIMQINGTWIKINKGIPKIFSFTRNQHRKLSDIKKTTIGQSSRQKIVLMSIVLDFSCSSSSSFVGYDQLQELMEEQKLQPEEEEVEEEKQDANQFTILGAIDFILNTFGY